MVTESNQRIDEQKNIEDAVKVFLEVRLEIIKENYSIFEYTYSFRSDFPPDLKKPAVLFSKKILNRRN